MGRTSLTPGLAANDASQPIMTIRGLWRTSRRSLRWVILTGIVLTVVASILSPLYDPTTVKMYVSLPQMFLLIGALGYVLPGPKGFRPIRKDIEQTNSLRVDVVRATGYEKVREWSDARHIAKNALARYTVYWRGMLASWVLLYACLVFIPSTTTQTLVIIFCTNCNTAFLVLIYNILNQSVDTKENEHDVNDVSWIMVSIAFVLASLALEIRVMRVRVPDEQRSILCMD